MSEVDTSAEAVRAYTWNGKTLPISHPDISDETVAGMVRMLMRDQLNHEHVCCLARDRIMCLSAENAALRARVEALEGALRFYAEHGAGCRLIHSGGDPSRAALSDDGGKIARAALSDPAREEGDFTDG